LAEGEHYYAVVFERDGVLERADYSLECWEGPPAGAFCSWRARIPERKERKRQFVDDEVLVDFFERLAGESEEAKVQFRFVLTLILMRKRLVKYVREIERDGARWWVVRLMGRFKPADEEEATHRVLNPELDEQQIEEVSRRLGVILTGDFSDFDRPEDSGEADEGTDGTEPAGNGERDA
jgi:hypothetical protein